MTNESTRRLYTIANQLAIMTIGYNIIEGAVSIWLGAADETLSLFGFGVDSFVEVISGIGIWHMLVKIKAKGGERDKFEKTALKITGTAFYILAVGLLITAVNNTLTSHKPETTFWGIVISLISIFTMSVLIFYKIKT